MHYQISIYMFTNAADGSEYQQMIIMMLISSWDNSTDLLLKCNQKVVEAAVLLWSRLRACIALGRTPWSLRHTWVTFSSLCH